MSWLPVDSWTEGFPGMEERTGIALRYESPESEPPHVVLIAVPPKVDGSHEWTDDLLANCVLETIELMKVRMVGAHQVASCSLALALPQLVFGLPSGVELFPTLMRLYYEYLANDTVFCVPASELSAAELAAAETNDGVAK